MTAWLCVSAWLEGGRHATKQQLTEVCKCKVAAYMAVAAIRPSLDAQAFPYAIPTASCTSQHSKGPTINKEDPPEMPANTPTL